MGHRARPGPRGERTRLLGRPRDGRASRGRRGGGCGEHEHAEKPPATGTPVERVAGGRGAGPLRGLTPDMPRAPWLRKAWSAAQAGPSSSPLSCACCLARKFYEETKATAPLFSKTRQARRGDGGVAAPARRATCGLCPWRPRPRAHSAASHAGISDALSRELISLLQAKYENDNLR